MACTTQTMEEYIKAKENLEDQMDYQFIQRIIQEVTQSCALPLPIPAESIPPLIYQAATYFWENYDFASEERYYCLKNKDITRCGPNSIIKLPSRIISVFNVVKTNDTYSYGALGDFSLERMILNNSVLSSGIGGSMGNTFGAGGGYNLTDVTAALYEVSTYQNLFDTPLSFNYNQYSHDLIILGALGSSDLILQTFVRCKIQDLYNLYYFFRFCVCLVLRSLSTIFGTFEYNLPGGIKLNYSNFRDQANEELKDIEEWVKSQRVPSYFFNSNTI